MGRASISISPPNDRWIQSQIESEEFSSRSEVVNDVIRRVRKREEEVASIRAALIQGELSGTPKPFDPDQFKQEMAGRYADKSG